jgi:hypothetical protein
MAKKKTATGSDPEMVLGQLTERYIKWMEDMGKSIGTQFSYRMEMKMAESELGATTLVSSLTADDIDRFNNSARVTKLKSGKPKAQPSIDKSRRVLRLALAYAEQEGLIAKSPIPAKVQHADEPAPEPEPTPAPKKGRRKALVEVVNEPTAEPVPAA